MNDNLKSFVGQIINLEANVQGASISSAGFAGAASPRQHSLDDLKRKTLEFASEYRKNDPSKEKLKELSNEVEGNLLGLNSLQVIDNNKLNSLTDELYSLNI
jgi:hypothetical protein